MKKRIYLCEFNLLMENSVYLPAVSGLLHAYADTFPDLKENYEFQPYIYYRDKIENIITKFDNLEYKLIISSSKRSQK